MNLQIFYAYHTIKFKWFLKNVKNQFNQLRLIKHAARPRLNAFFHILSATKQETQATVITSHLTNSATTEHSARSKKKKKKTRILRHMQKEIDRERKKERKKETKKQVAYDLDPALHLPKRGAVYMK
jgi:hypothetical protein